MKRMQPLVLVIGAGLCVFAAATVSAAETKKPETYKERMARQSESYTPEGEKVDSKDAKDAKAEPELFPLATRVPASQKGANSLVKIRNQMVTAFQKGKDDEAQIAADKLETDAAATPNDRATALQVKLLLVTKKDNNNHAAAIPLLEEMIATDGLGNNAHYGMLQQLAQRYLLDQDYQNALLMTDRFLNETKSETKEMLTVKGNSLYRLKRMPEALVVLEKVHAVDPANVPVTQMLTRAYAETGQLDKAAALTKTLAQTGASDKSTKINLAISYRDAKQFEQAADIIEELRATNQLTEERDYLTAMNVYAGMKKKEHDMVQVVQEGLDKGILKPTANNYVILAEAYYYSNRDDGTVKAISNWQKAAPLSKDGTTYLNLAIVQCQEEMWLACKESAKSAIAKGGIDVNDAKTQIAKAEKELGKSR